MNDSGRNDKLGSAKPSYSFVFGEKTYYLDFETQRLKAAFESWAISDALANLSARRAMTGEDDYRMDRDNLNARIESGDYALDGGKPMKGQDGKITLPENTIRKLFQTQKGILAWVRLMLQKKHPEVTESTVREMLSDKPTADILESLLERITVDSSPKSAGSEPVAAGK